MAVLTGAAIFDGEALLHDHALVLDGDRVAALIPASEAPSGTRHLPGGVIAPGFVDLQVNGGAGLMVGAGSDAGQLATICAAQAASGTLACLPTLITDTPQTTARVIAAGIEATRRATPGFLGLHLEGPHLDPARAGAHDPALIRPMGAEDLARLCAAAHALPALMITLAPEAAMPEQIAALAGAGAVISLGHSDCSFEAAQAAIRAGARCATHLFNAMSGLGHRAPGLAGAVLTGGIHAGLIADGLHVHPAALRVALAARPEGLFLVSDAMGFAGTDATEMHLQGRLIRREGGRLTLLDGTLAGADLTLARAVALLVRDLGIPPARALAMATSIPAGLIGAPAGRIGPGRAADLVWLRPDWSVGAVWQGGQPLPEPAEDGTRRAGALIRRADAPP